MAFTAIALEGKEALDQATEDRALWTKFVNEVTAEFAEIRRNYGEKVWQAIHDEPLPVPDCSARPWRIFESVVRSRRDAEFFERVWTGFNQEKNRNAYRRGRGWGAAAVDAGAAAAAAERGV